LYGLQEALSRGLMTADDVPDAAEAVRRATHAMAEAERLMEAWAEDPAIQAALARLEEASVTSADIRGAAADVAGDVEEAILPGGEMLIECGSQVRWQAADGAHEGLVSRIVVHEGEDFDRYATFNAEDTEGRVHLHVLASAIEEAPFDAALHPRDRLGEFARLPSATRPSTPFEKGRRVGSMNAKQVHKLLVRHGFEQQRQKGSHAVFRNPRADGRSSCRCTAARCREARS
jgi:hypothetical protein